MPIRFLFFCLFPLVSCAQTFSYGRFVARNHAIVWTEKFEIKDMDEPIIVDAVKEQLGEKEYVRFDTLQQHEIVSGWLINPPATTIAKARFRVDILYEGYVVAVSEIVESASNAETPLESCLLKSDGSFIKNIPKRAETLDNLLIKLFEIKQ
ncbi:hypothetical protein [Runella aurantiaca]|uniref:DUF4468 domain-containing protein n=1 Tax=Runella aurantiaca TaxID=2282308 RepID=A0A369ID37_9BACT|nr:hypothetical protein [Runella aurantiaca]RDB07679.1 hypothetical protein DVG78_01045 [Runella aurantiaca]